MRRCKASVKEPRVCSPDFVIAFPLPCAVVQIVQSVENLAFDLAAEAMWCPVVTQRPIGLGCQHWAIRSATALACAWPELGERQLRAAAKALRVDSFDVPMPGSNEFRHRAHHVESDDKARALLAAKRIRAPTTWAGGVILQACLDAEVQEKRVSVPA